MAWFDGVLESIGKGLAEAGESCLESGVEVWQFSTAKVLEYCTSDPVTLGSATGNPWVSVTTIFSTFKGVGVGLLTLYFVIGYLRESIDIRSSFTLENMFRFFVRLILTATALDTALSLIREVLGLSAKLAATVGASVSSGDVPVGVFDNIMTGLSGGSWIGIGFICLLGGLIGMFVIIVCGYQILLAVVGRFFKIYLIVPFAPIAISSFAGGQGLSQSGIAWIKTFAGHCLEIVVIAMALVLSFTMFGSGSGIFLAASDGVPGAILQICELVLPIVIAVASVKGAEATIRKCLGL